eukprot:TRINITY_DN26386_c0_g1_i1.p1 TRINITY_DN26386_c0_g1~~TRINITY_DN26386_c0_g1_i1.p1  ORF type:complete len:2003 (-),score=437.94 TRINITY_DN26386_c0_g1_i1:41-5536(-)
MDRGGKGYISAEDLRVAVLSALGADETLKDLGLDPTYRLSLADFPKVLNFDLAALTKHLKDVFGDESAISESDFCNRLEKLGGVDEATSQIWLQLMYPTGLPDTGVGRGACEIFLATTPAVVLPSASASFSTAVDIRSELKKCGEAAGLPVGEIPAWVVKDTAKSWLKGLAAKDADSLLRLVGEASKKYAGPAVDEVVAGPEAATLEVLRSETLLACSERAQAVEHLLEVQYKSMSGFAKAAEIMLRYYCHGTGCVADTPGPELDFGATHTFTLSRPDALAKLFEGREDAITIQAWIALSKGELRRPLAVAVLPATELRDFLTAAASAQSMPESLLGSKKAWDLSFQKIQPEPKPAPPDAATSGKVSLSVHYSLRPTQDPRSLPLPWSSSFSGRLVVCRPGVASSGCGDPEEAPSGLLPRPEPPAPAEPPPGSVVLSVALKGFVLWPDSLRGLVARCLEGQLLPAPSEPGGLAKKAPGIFARICLFPGKPAMQVAGCSGWVESSVKPFPEALLRPTDLPGPPGSELAVAPPQVSLDFAWQSPPLEAAQAVDALKDGTLAVEIWLRHPAADLRLSEKALPLKRVLEEVSPEEPGELRLRTLRPAIVPLTPASFEREGKPLAELAEGSVVKLELPNGPGVLSWLLPVETPKPAEPPDPEKANYTVTMQEILLSGDFAAQLAGEADCSAFVAPADQHRQPAFGAGSRQQQEQQALAMPFYFVEIAEGRLNAGAGSKCWRSAPQRGQLDSQGWVRVRLGEDARLCLTGRLVLGGGPPVKEKEHENQAADAALLRGESHTISLRLLQMLTPGDPQGSRLAMGAEVLLPLGRQVEGAPAPYFGGQLWIPLMHAAPDGPWTAVVGRALLRVEAERPEAGAARLLRQLPLAPGGLLLPLYKDWQAPKVFEAPPGPQPWPSEAATRAIAGEDLWKRLQKDEAWPGALKSGAFQAALQAAGEGSSSPLLGGGFGWLPAAASRARGPVAVQEDLSFLCSAVPPLMSDAEVLVPYPQFLVWLGIRSLARAVLPVSAGLLRRLQELDGGSSPGGGGRHRAASGAVPLASFQAALRAELSQAAGFAGGGSDLPAALWQLLGQRTEWMLGAGGPYSLGGHEHFDYLVFLWDLQASVGGQSSELLGSGASPALRPPPGSGATAPGLLPELSPQAEDTTTSSASAAGSLALSIHSALHLPQIEGEPPSAFVSYCWRCPELSAGSGHGASTMLGRTEVAPPNASPRWAHTVELPLPEVLHRGARMSYPEAFKELFLELWVWHAGRSDDVLIGGAEMSLAPLRSSFHEVDGYFHILAAEDLGTGRDLAELPQTNRGQLRASATPRWVSPDMLRAAPRDASSSRSLGAGIPGRASAFSSRVPAAAALRESSGGSSPSGPCRWPFVADGPFVPPPSFAAAERLSAPWSTAPSLRRPHGVERPPLFTPDPLASLSVTPPPLPPPLLPPSTSSALPGRAADWQWRRDPEVDLQVLNRVLPSEALPRDWGCPRAPLADHLWHLGLSGTSDVKRVPGVEDDVSELALRAASYLSDTERQLRSLAGSEQEQLEQLRARHRENLEDLGQYMRSKLLPSAGAGSPPLLEDGFDAARGFGRASFQPLSVPQPGPSAAAALSDLAAASAAAAFRAAAAAEERVSQVAAPGMASGPLPLRRSVPTAEVPSWFHSPASYELPAATEAAPASSSSASAHLGARAAAASAVSFEELPGIESSGPLPPPGAGTGAQSEAPSPAMSAPPLPPPLAHPPPLLSSEDGAGRPPPLQVRSGLLESFAGGASRESEEMRMASQFEESAGEAAGFSSGLAEADRRRLFECIGQAVAGRTVQELSPSPDDTRI